MNKMLGKTGMSPKTMSFLKADDKPGALKKAFDKSLKQRHQSQNLIESKEYNLF